MFSSKEGYTYKAKNSRKECDGELCFRRHTFTFKSERSNQTYIVEVDEFDEFLLCIIKFYLKAHRLSNRKFQLMTKLQEAPSLITTCINIMFEFYHKNPYRSFGFIGMNSENELEQNTRRFQVYRKVMERAFSPSDFFHFTHIPKSAYLLLNRHYAENNLELLGRIEAFFNKHYDLT